MEQRNQTRKTATLGAVVSCPQFGLFSGQIDNLSTEGLFVRTTSVAVCLNAPVSVNFQPEPDRPSLNFTAEGVVVHQNTRGIGIRFTRLEAACLQALQALSDQWPEPQEVKGSQYKLVAQA